MQDLPKAMVPLVRQSAGGSLELLSVEQMIDMAVKVAQDLHKAVEKRLEEEDKQQEAPTPGITFLM